jgi:hypothetical protein
MLASLGKHVFTDPRAGFMVRGVILTAAAFQAEGRISRASCRFSRRLHASLV